MQQRHAGPHVQLLLLLLLLLTWASLRSPVCSMLGSRKRLAGQADHTRAPTGQLCTGSWPAAATWLSAARRCCFWAMLRARQWLAAAALQLRMAQQRGARSQLSSFRQLQMLLLPQPHEVKDSSRGCQAAMGPPRLQHRTAEMVLHQRCSLECCSSAASRLSWRTCAFVLQRPWGPQVSAAIY